jgi:hypothetical protein
VKDIGVTSGGNDIFVLKSYRQNHKVEKMEGKITIRFRHRGKNIIVLIKNRLRLKRAIKKAQILGL